MKICMILFDIRWRRKDFEVNKSFLNLSSFSLKPETSYMIKHLYVGMEFPWNLQEFIGICANFTLVILYKSHKIPRNG